MSVYFKVTIGIWIKYTRDPLLILWYGKSPLKFTRQVTNYPSHLWFLLKCMCRCLVGTRTQPELIPDVFFVNLFTVHFRDDHSHDKNQWNRYKQHLCLCGMNRRTPVSGRLSRRLSLGNFAMEPWAMVKDNLTHVQISFSLLPKADKFENVSFG